jgi:hypothetical protein
MCDAGQYVAGEIITLNPGTNSGYTFSTWTGATVISNKLTMPAADTTVTARFLLASDPCYLLTKVASPIVGGTITASPTYSTGCPSGRYKPGQIITFTAVPKLYYHFDHWAGGVNATTNKLTMPTRSITIYAYFATNLRRGTYNDNYVGIVHTATWLTQYSGLYFGGTQHYTRTKTSTVTINFTGTRFGMYYTAAKTNGRVTIQLDNRTPVLLNEYALTTAYRRLWWGSILPSGNHKAVITYYTSNPLNTPVNFDGIVIQ